MANSNFIIELAEGSVELHLPKCNLHNLNAKKIVLAAGFTAAGIVMAIISNAITDAAMALLRSEE